MTDLICLRGWLLAPARCRLLLLQFLHGINLVTPVVWRYRNGLFSIRVQERKKRKTARAICGQTLDRVTDVDVKKKWNSLLFRALASSDGETLKLGLCGSSLRQEPFFFFLSSFFSASLLLSTCFAADAVLFPPIARLFFSFSPPRASPSKDFFSACCL